MITVDRRTLCWHAYAGGHRPYRYVCTLPLGHTNPDHEDHLTEAPCVYAWAVTPRKD